jgi:4-diphosphocytidyl-2-C-methyl-D-erythritol kinase
MQQVSVKGYAKINLTLDVLGKRDDGYHEVAMIMQGINLYDVVTLEKRKAGIMLDSNLLELSSGPDNLAYQAAALLQKDFPVIEGIHIKLSKKIPLAAGLAGGSTDAAAVLLGLNLLYKLGLSLDQLRTYGSCLGSDIPFCLHPLTALATGRGEMIKELPPCPPLWLVLVKPPFGVSTKEVYGHLKEVIIKERPSLERALEALETGDLGLLYHSMANVLEYATFDLYPELQHGVEKLRNAGAKKAMMSGSGPTLIAFVENETKAKELASSWTKSDWQVVVTRSLGPRDLDRRIVVDE